MLEDKLKKIITDAVDAQYKAGFEAGYNDTEVKRTDTIGVIR